MKRIVLSARSITRAANAGSSTSSPAPTPARSSTEGRPTTEASRSAGAAGGSSSRRARTKPSSVSGTGSGRTGSMSARKTGELERIERVSARNVVHAQERRPRERPAEPCLQDAVRGTETDRADRQPLHAVARDGVRVPRSRLLRRGDGPAGGGWAAHAAAAVQTPARSPRTDRATGRRRSRARPGPAPRERPTRSNGDAERGSEPPCIIDEERHLERPAPRRRQRRQHVREHALEQVAEGGMGEAALHLGRLRQKDSQPRACAASTPARQSVDFPMPASPSSTTAASRSAVWSRTASRNRSSSSLPQISPDISSDDRDRAMTRLHRPLAHRQSARKVPTF